MLRSLALKVSDNNNSSQEKQQQQQPWGTQADCGQEDWPVARPGRARQPRPAMSNLLCQTQLYSCDIFVAPQSKTKQQNAKAHTHAHTLHTLTHTHSAAHTQRKKEQPKFSKCCNFGLQQKDTHTQRETHTCHSLSHSTPLPPAAPSLRPSLSTNEMKEEKLQINELNRLAKGAIQLPK